MNALSFAWSCEYAGMTVDRVDRLKTHYFRRIRSLRGRLAVSPCAQCGGLYEHVQESTLEPMVTMTVSEARAALPELLTRVQGGEEVTITRHGRAVAVVVRPDTLRSRRATAASGNAERIRDLLASAKATALPEMTGLSAGRAEQLIAEIRAGRESR